MAYHHYNIKLKHLARKLRNNQTKAERKIWYDLLAKRQFGGIPFLRQRIIDRYIVDFFSKYLKLIIEVDGKYHDFEEVIRNDKIRVDRLRELGFHIVRFTNYEVLNDLGGVAERLTEFIQGIDLKY